MLISEDLLLLLTEGEQDTASQDVVDTAVAGGVVVELALRQVVEVSDGSAAPVGLVRRVGALFEPDDLLVRALRALEPSAVMPLPQLVDALRERTVPAHVERLEEQGLLRRVRASGATLASAPAYRSTGGGRRQQLVEQMANAEAGDAESTPRADALATLYTEATSLDPEVTPRDTWNAPPEGTWAERLREVPSVWAATAGACHEIRAAHLLRGRHESWANWLGDGFGLDGP